MNDRVDYPDDMREFPVDDAVAEALLRGDAPAPEPDLAAVAAFVRDMRATACRAAPAPSPALAALLREGSAPPAVAVRPVRRRSPMAGWRRRLAVTGIGFGVAVTGVVGAAAAGLLPDAVERVVGGVVETLTPLELPARDSDIDARPPDLGSDGSPGTDAVPSTGGGGEPVPGAPGSTPSPQPAPGAPGSVTPEPGPGTSTTGRAPGPGLTTPVVTPPSAPTAGPVPVTSTTLPSLAPVPTPTLPNTTLPVPPGSVPSTPPTLPNLPW